MLGVRSQEECVNMISRLFHAPLYEGEDAVGAATIGSSEAFMLAGLPGFTIWFGRCVTLSRTAALYSE